MYLAMLGTTLDDVPLKLFKTRESAQEFIDGHPPEVPDRTMDLIMRDRAEPLHFYIAEFNPLGDLVGFELIRSIDDDPDS